MTTITFPTEAQLINARVQAGMAGDHPATEPVPRQPTTAQLVRERAEEDARDLDYFVQAIAEHFDCPSLLSDQTRIKLRGPFLELRALAHRLRAEDERRAAQMPADSGRDGHGRFTGRR